MKTEWVGSPLKPGRYDVVVTSATIFRTKKKRKFLGEKRWRRIRVLQIELTVIGGREKGKKIFDRLALVMLRMRTLAEFLRAIRAVGSNVKSGKRQFDTDDLKNRILSVRGAPDTFTRRNKKIKAFRIEKYLKSRRRRVEPV